MLTGPTGKPVSLDERIADVERRYGPDNVVPRSLRQARPALRRAIDLIEVELRQLDLA